ncbi:MAG: 6-carboxytetrahydropterin synthase QueD [Armatimonadota bacterium]|nr:6-carboxytetrahydropterin synthase QueD [Armatimonadota bacterium]
MFEILIEDSFDAAHNLRGYQGNCERLHGHTYRTQVFIRGKSLDEQGMSIDFRQAKTELASALAQLDHQYLNDLPLFQVENPSAENLARYIYNAMDKSFPGHVHRVTVWETPTSAASYWKDE